MVWYDYIPSVEGYLPVVDEIWMFKNFAVKLYSEFDQISYPLVPS